MATPPLGSVPQVTFGGLLYDVYTHISTFYDSDAGRLRMTAPLLEDGLRAGQPCFLIADGEALSAYLDRLREAAGLDVDALIESGLLTIDRGIGSRRDEGLSFWENSFWSKVEGGASVLRAVAEMASVREGFISEAEMLAFEAAMNGILKRFPCFGVCQYDVRRFSGPTLFAALRAHSDLYAMPLRTVIS